MVQEEKNRLNSDPCQPVVAVVDVVDVVAVVRRVVAPHQCHRPDFLHHSSLPVERVLPSFQPMHRSQLATPGASLWRGSGLGKAGGLEVGKIVDQLADDSSRVSSERVDEHLSVLDSISGTSGGWDSIQ